MSHPDSDRVQSVTGVQPLLNLDILTVIKIYILVNTVDKSAMYTYTWMLAQSLQSLHSNCIVLSLISKHL